MPSGPVYRQGPSSLLLSPPLPPAVPCLPWAPPPLPWCCPREKLNFATAAGGGCCYCCCGFCCCCCCCCWYLGGGGRRAGQTWGADPVLHKWAVRTLAVVAGALLSPPRKWHVPSGVPAACPTRRANLCVDAWLVDERRLRPLSSAAVSCFCYIHVAGPRAGQTWGADPVLHKWAVRTLAVVAGALLSPPRKWHVPSGVPAACPTRRANLCVDAWLVDERRLRPLSSAAVTPPSLGTSSAV